MAVAIFVLERAGRPQAPPPTRSGPDCPADFFERPAARVYAALSPQFRTNGCYAAFWFRFTPANLAALIRKLRR